MVRNEDLGVGMVLGQVQYAIELVQFVKKCISTPTHIVERYFFTNHGKFVQKQVNMATYFWRCSKHAIVGLRTHVSKRLCSFTSGYACFIA